MGCFIKYQSARFVSPKHTTWLAMTARFASAMNASAEDHAAYVKLAMLVSMANFPASTVTHDRAVRLDHRQHSPAGTVSHDRAARPEPMALTVEAVRRHSSSFTPLMLYDRSAPRARTIETMEHETLHRYHALRRLSASMACLSEHVHFMCQGFQNAVMVHSYYEGLVSENCVLCHGF